ncbi:MAG: hypothetical protein AUG51_23985 [Acidobacteria bacterium 13_1_20CM_3_53_8]|nr:MAG: hypothetical protein AUG51_23985 [Acidobacteria bacterium 13_1_20CM_3_53_8]
MLQWYLRVMHLTREMRRKAFDAFDALLKEDKEKASVINEYLANDFQTLRGMWLEGKNVPSHLGRHILFGEAQDYKDMLMNDISEIEAAAEQYLLNEPTISKPEVEYVYDVFVSFSSLDQELANTLYDAITKADGKAFLSSKHLHPGDDFAEEIRNQLTASRELWLLVSPNSLKSEWVLTEWGAAWMAGKKIVPIIHRCKPEDLPDRLKRFQCIDFYNYMRLVERTFKTV